MKTRFRSCLGTSVVMVLGLLLILPISCKKTGDNPDTVADKDGNRYTWVTIGTQVWMKENLKTTKYNDGTSIPLVTDDGAWSNLSAPGYCWNNNKKGFESTDGALYNWYTVNAGNLCSAGWHVPTNDEWTTLLNYLNFNGFNYDGSTSGWKVGKSLAATDSWALSSTPGAVGNTDYPGMRNATGFTALPDGYRDTDGTVKEIGNWGYWWSDTEKDAVRAWSRYLIYSSPLGLDDISDKRCGFSARCLRD